jgi:hypothetical protein
MNERGVRQKYAKRTAIATIAAKRRADAAPGLYSALSTGPVPAGVPYICRQEHFVPVSQTHHPRAALCKEFAVHHRNIIET